MTAMAVVIFFMAFNVSRLDNAFNYVDENNKRVIDTMNEGLGTIPDDASVTATTFLALKLPIQVPDISMSFPKLTLDVQVLYIFWNKS